MKVVHDDGLAPGNAQTLDDVVDAHVHVWPGDPVTYPWLREAPQLLRTFDLEHVSAEQSAVGVTQIVLVQAADSVADTEHMLTSARHHPHVAGVVGWVPLRDVATAEALLARWHHEPIVGIRHLVHRDPDPQLLIDPAVQEVLELITEHDLAFDVCAESTNLLELVPIIAARHPRLTLIVDHLAKPPIRDRGWQPWARLIAQAAEAPNVFVKLSGLNTAAAPSATSEDYAPYVDHALLHFGPERMMYGGDWPFALLAAESYTQIWEPLRRSLDGLEAHSLQAVMAGTARRAYRLPAGCEVGRSGCA